MTASDGVLLSRREAEVLLRLCRRAGLDDLGEMEIVAELSLAVAALRAGASSSTRRP